MPQRRPDVTADSTTHTNGSVLSPVEQLSQSTGSGSAASQSSIMKFFRNISGPPPPPGPPPHGDGSNLRPKKQKKRPVSKYVNLNSYVCDPEKLKHNYVSSSNAKMLLALICLLKTTTIHLFVLLKMWGHSRVFNGSLAASEAIFRPKIPSPQSNFCTSWLEEFR